MFKQVGVSEPGPELGKFQVEAPSPLTSNSHQLRRILACFFLPLQRHLPWVLPVGPLPQNHLGSLLKHRYPGLPGVYLFNKLVRYSKARPG